jgi:apolipoprotein N-acyltransferase
MYASAQPLDFLARTKNPSFPNWKLIVSHPEFPDGHYLKKRWVQPGDDFMSLIIYLIGFAFVIGGIAWVLVLAGVSTIHVTIAIVILVGIAILTGVTRTRTKD